MIDLLLELRAPLDTILHPVLLLVRASCITPPRITNQVINYRLFALALARAVLNFFYLSDDPGIVALIDAVPAIQNVLLLVAPTQAIVPPSDCVLLLVIARIIRIA